MKVFFKIDIQILCILTLSLSQAQSNLIERVFLGNHFLLEINNIFSSESSSQTPVLQITIISKEILIDSLYFSIYIAVVH